jgi:hypothetical protein
MKWAGNQSGRENRESGTSLAQKAMENNDSGMLEEIFYRQFDIAQDRAQ